MYKTFLSLPFAAFLLAFANPQPVQSPVVVAQSLVATPPKTTTTCYEMTDKLGGKTQLQLTITDQKVTGTLNFRSAKGERVTGTLVGTATSAPDATLLQTVYTQTAQGRKYVNERYFKINSKANEKTILEGEGEQKQDLSDVFRYKNPKTVKYKRVMKMVKC